MAHSTSTTDSLIVRLNSGNTSSAELEQATGKSQSWVSTALRRLITQRRVVRVGSRRGARYALRRDIPPIGSAWPLYRVGRDGEPIDLGTLYALVADEFYLEATKAATAAGLAVASLSAGIPYLLQDQRPGGSLAAQFRNDFHSCMLRREFRTGPMSTTYDTSRPTEAMW